MGVYALTIVVADRAGNVSVPHRFTYRDEIKPPRVVSLSPPPKSRLNRLTEITAVIEDQSGTGIDFSPTGSTIELRSPDDVVVGGIIVDDGVDTMMLKLLDPLLTDGSDDGVYAITVQPVDQRGISGEARQFRITYDTQNPRVQSVSHIDMTSNVSNVNDSVRRIETELIDNGSGIDFESSSVQLWRHTEEGRVLVPGVLDNDGSLLWWQLDNPLARSGVDDGLYSVEIKAVDNAGNVEEKAFGFLYGTQTPVISSISPSAKSRLNRLTEITAVIEDQSGTGIDFSPTGSTIELRSPDDVVVGGIIVDDGVDTMMLKLLDPLLTDGSDDGVYAITVQPVDQRGISGEARQFRITYDTQNPRVQSVSHIDMTSNVSNVNDSVRRIETELIDNGSGIDFESSSVQLWRHTEEGRVLVPGVLDNDGSLLWWQLDNPLARSGVDDGLYSVEIKAVDNAGNVEEKAFGFLYGTQTPVISSISPSAKSRLNRLTEITAVIEDQSGTGIDFSPTGSTIELRSPDDVVVGGIIVDDGVDTMMLKLLDPLLTDGSDDGVYAITVQPVDQLGVSGEARQFRIIYDTQNPRVQSVSHIDMTANVSNVKDSVRRIEVELIETGRG